MPNYLSCPKAHIAIDNPATREVPTTEDVMEESLVETQVLELHWGSRYKERKKTGTRFHVHCVLVFLRYPCEK